MTTWISSLLRRNGNQQIMAVIKSDGLLLQVYRVPWHRRLPPFLLTLDLRVSAGGELTRVVEVRGETPQDCAALVTQLLAVAKQGHANAQPRTPST